jgi:hypothetical protein
VTSLKLIDIYLDGFRSCHDKKLSKEACPYVADTPQSEYWQRGHLYAQYLDKTLASFYQNQETLPLRIT